MTDQTVQCARCGFANVPGDQFCGSCGTFLEWEGTPASGATTPPTSSGPLAASAVAPAAGSTASAQPSAGPTPAPGPAGDPAADGLLRCPACGIANPASRTFCQTCGAKLTPAAKVATRSRDEIAAAVSAVPTAAPPPPVPGVAPGAKSSKAAPAAKRGGVPGWVFAIIALGVLVGVAAVVGSQMLKGSGPASDASAAPTPSGPAAAASSSPSGFAPAASAGASGQPAGPTPAPIAGKPLKLTRASASSIAGGNTGKYGPQLAIDGNLKTSWQEGSATEKGEWIEVSFDASTVTAVVVRNGFQASTALYKGNLRLKDVLISVNGGAPKAVRLSDTTSAQKIDLGQVPGATKLRITIVSTYPSVKTAVAGTPFKDAAVSEISVLGVKGG